MKCPLCFLGHHLARTYSNITMYLLTEWEGRTGKYLARVHGVRTERSEVRAPWPRAEYFSRPARPNSVNKRVSSQGLLHTYITKTDLFHTAVKPRLALSFFIFCSLTTWLEKGTYLVVLLSLNWHFLQGQCLLLLINVSINIMQKNESVNFAKDRILSRTDAKFFVPSNREFRSWKTELNRNKSGAGCTYFLS